MKAPEEETDAIAISTELLSSLMDEIPLVQTFKGKWSLIRAKLDDLRPQLADFADSPDAASNPLSLDLFRSVSAALNDAVSVARRCQSPSFAEGKLRTQSDVDAVLARLDRVVRVGEILLRSGVLSDNNRAVVSNSGNSGSSSRREAVRAESRNLITRLQIGTPESRNSAMDSLLGLLRKR